MDEKDQEIALDQVRDEVDASLERARELLCEYKLTLDQQGDVASREPAAAS